MDNNKIPGFNPENQQQIEQYKAAFDSLRDSVTSLNKPLATISNSISSLDKDISKFTDTINKLTALNNTLSDSGDKIKKNLTDVSAAFSAWNGIIKLVSNSLGEWGTALSAGLTILNVYGDGILKWVKNMVQGNATLSALGQTMKNNAIIANTLIQAKLQGVQAAQREITDLNTLYRATQNRNLSLSQQKEAVKALKAEWPEAFKNINDETIIAGKAAGAYKNLKDQIIATAYAEAAKNKITENAGRILGNEQKIIQERAKNLAIIKEQQKAGEALMDVSPKETDSFSDRLRKNTDGYDRVITAATDAYNKQSELRAASDKIIYGLTTDTNLLTRQNDQFYQEIEKRIKLFSVSVAGYKPALDYISRSATSKKTDQPQEQLSQNNNQCAAAEKLQAMSVGFAQTIELEKKNYDTEKALLDDQLNKKLLSQQKYFEQGQQLEEKYHTTIGTRIDEFNQADLDKAKKHLEDMASATLHEQVMDDDQKKVNEAILPTAKLDAEKKMISDKYDYEISLVTGNAGKIKELEDQKQKDITDLVKKYDQERKDFELQSAQQVSNAAFSILKNSIKSQSDAKIQQLETQKTAELNNSSLTSSQKQAIENKYKQQEAEEKIKAFKDEQKASILQAVINGALAVTKATAQSGVLSPFVVPGIIAETAIQIATIAAQKTPQYAKGGLHYKSDGKGALLSGYSRTDNMNAYLRSGEAVVVSEAMRDPWARNLVSAINVAYGGRDFSMTNPGRGYAIGGIFTDGGNSNRYYNQPMNNQKDLANTIAYQMINNFPPVYVDVKDINNQQNILAQTINRVNL